MCNAARYVLKHALAVAELVKQSDHDRVQRPLGCFEFGAREDQYDLCREIRCPIWMRMANKASSGKLRMIGLLSPSAGSRSLNTHAKRSVREFPNSAHGPLIDGAVDDARRHPRGVSARRIARRYEPSPAGAAG